MDILSLDATDQLQELAALRISARELLEASVLRTDRLNPKLNAVTPRPAPFERTPLEICLANVAVSALCAH